MRTKPLIEAVQEAGDIQGARLVLLGVSVSAPTQWDLIRGRADGSEPRQPKNEPLADDVYQLQVGGVVVASWTGSVPLGELLALLAPGASWLAMCQKVIGSAMANKRFPNGDSELYHIAQVVVSD